MHKDLISHALAVAGEAATASEPIQAIFLIGSAARDAHNSSTSDVDLLIVINDDVTETRLRKAIDVLKSSALPIDATMIRDSAFTKASYPTKVEMQIKPDGNEIRPIDPKCDTLLSIQDAAECGIWLGGYDRNYKIPKVPWDLLKQSVDYVFPFLRTHFKNPSLSLSRAAYTYKNRRMCSKIEAGSWALSELDPRYHQMIADDLSSYRVGSRYTCPADLLTELETTISEATRKGSYMIDKSP